MERNEQQHVNMLHTSIFFHIKQLVPFTKLPDNFPISLLFLHIFKRRNFRAARYSQFHFVRKNLGCRPYGAAPLWFWLPNTSKRSQKDSVCLKFFIPPA